MYARGILMKLKLLMVCFFVLFLSLIIIINPVYSNPVNDNAWGNPRASCAIHQSPQWHCTTSTNSDGERVRSCSWRCVDVCETGGEVDGHGQNFRWWASGCLGSTSTNCCQGVRRDVSRCIDHGLDVNIRGRVLTSMDVDLRQNTVPTYLTSGWREETGDNVDPTNYGDRRNTENHNFDFRTFCSLGDGVLELQIERIGKTISDGDCVPDSSESMLYDWMRVGYCYDGEYYPDGSPAADACRVSIDHLHRIRGSDYTFIPYSPQSPSREVGNLAHWIIDEDEFSCCGDNMLGLGQNFDLGDDFFVCTASEDGHFGWLPVSDIGSNFQEAIGVYTVAFDRSHWLYRYDSHGNYFTQSTNHPVSNHAWDYSVEDMWGYTSDVSDNEFTTNPYSYSIATTGTGELFACGSNNVLSNLDSHNNIDELSYGDFRGAVGYYYLCAGNYKLVTSGNGFGFQSIIDDSKTENLIAICASDGLTPVDISGVDNNSRLLNSNTADFVVSGDAGSKDIFYCSDSFGYLTNQQFIDFDSDENPGILSDFTCDRVDLTYIYGDHSYELLDRFWRTSENCCGPGKLDDNPRTFSDSGVTQGPSGSLNYNPNTDFDARRACWNGIAVPHGSTIGYASDGNFDSIDSSPYNLLRVPPSSPFELDGDVLKGWNYNEAITPLLVNIFENSNMIIMSHPGQYNYNEIVLTSKNSFYLQENMPYNFVLETTGYGGIGFSQIDFMLDNSKFQMSLVDEEGSKIPIDLRINRNYDILTDEIPMFSNMNLNLDDHSAIDEILHDEIIVDESKYYKLKIEIKDIIHFEELDFKTFMLVPRPLVLVDGGNFRACKDSYGNNPFSGTDLDGDGLISSESLADHCIEKVGDNICSVEGVWINSIDPDTGYDRSQVSKSPNIIRDSGFESGGSFNLGNCNFINNADGVYFGHPESQNRYSVGKYYLSCTEVDDSILLRGSGDDALDYENGYIFSAMVKGEGKITMGDSSIEFYNSSWSIIEVHGFADDGSVKINFEGTFSIDAVQLEEKSLGQVKRGNFFENSVQASCCPATSCWDGLNCINADSDNIDSHLYNVDFRTHNGQKGYVCLGNGNFEFAEKSYRWIDHTIYDYDEKTTRRLRDNDPSIFDDPSVGELSYIPEFGFCQIGDCYVGRNLDSASSLNPANINRTDCISGANSHSEISSSNEYMGRYCMQGEWYSKTPFVASFLENIAEELSSTYSLFCGDYPYVLNYYEFEFDEGSYYDILGQSVASKIHSSGRIVPIKYADKACALKFGQAPDNLMLAIPLNYDAFGNGDYPIGDNDPYDFLFSPDDMKISSVFNYFGLENGGRGCSRIDNFEEDRFISCGSGIFYNPLHKVILYYPGRSALNLIERSSLAPLNYGFEDVVGGIISNLENDDTFISDNKDDLWALRNHTKYDDVFRFVSPNEKITVSRQKLLDVRDVDLEFFKYLLIAHIDNFDVSGEFEEFDSPVRVGEQISVVDAFNTTNDVVMLDDNSFLVFSLERYSESDLFRNWHIFTGRLRGELELPPRE